MKKLYTLTLSLLLCGCATYRVAVQDQATVERLRKIPVVRIEFDDMAMSDVVKCLTMDLHCICHPNVYPTQTIGKDCVTYVIPFDTFDGEVPDCPASLLKGTNETPVVRFGPAITLRIADRTMLDVVEEVSRQSHGTAIIGKELITIRTKKVKPPAAHGQKWPLQDPF